jgi:hypothetical protein
LTRGKFKQKASQKVNHGFENDSRVNVFVYWCSFQVIEFGLGKNDNGFAGKPPQKIHLRKDNREDSRQENSLKMRKSITGQLNAEAHSPQKNSPQDHFRAYIFNCKLPSE